MLTKKKNKESLCKTPTPDADADADLKSIFVHWVHLLNKDAVASEENGSCHKTQAQDRRDAEERLESIFVHWVS